MTIMSSLPLNTAEFSGVTLVAGVGQEVEAVVDLDDGTYIDVDQADPSFHLAYDLDPGIWSGGQTTLRFVKRFRVMIRHRIVEGDQGGPLVARVYLTTGSEKQYVVSFPWVRNGEINTVYSPWVTIPVGATFNTSTMQIHFEGSQGYDVNARPQFMKLAVEFDVNWLPMIDNVTMSREQYPTISWAAHDEDGDRIDRFHIKMFGDPQVASQNLVPFDPTYATADIYDTGVVYSNATTWTSPVPWEMNGLSDVNVGVAYLRVGSVDGAWSIWSQLSVAITRYETLRKPVWAGSMATTGIPQVNPSEGTITLSGRIQDNLLSMDQASTEFEVADWQVTGAAATRTTAQAWPSLNASAPMQRAALRLTADSSGGILLENNKRWRVEPGQAIYWVTRIRAQTAARQGTLHLFWFNEVGVPLTTTDGTSVNTTVGSWTGLTCIATAPTGAHYFSPGLDLLNTLNGEVFDVDGSMLTYWAGSATDIGTPGVGGLFGRGNKLNIEHSSFGTDTDYLDFPANEGIYSWGLTWDILEWPPSQLDKSSVEVYEGNVALRVSTDAGAGEGPTILQPSLGAPGVLVQAGRRYQIGARVYLSATILLAMRVIWKNAEGVPIGQDYAQTDGTPLAVQDWIQLPYVFATAPPGAVYGMPQIFIRNDTSQTLYIDAVEFMAGAEEADESNPIPWMLGMGDSWEGRIEVERRVVGTNTWVPVRTATPVIPAQETGVFEVIDYEAPLGKSVQYRVRTAGPQIDEGSYPTQDAKWVASDWLVSSATAVAVTSGDNWLRALTGDPADSIRLSVIDWRVEYPEEMAVYEPIGRANYVPVKDRIRGAKMKVTVDFISQADRDKFLELRGRQTELLLQRGFTGEQWYVVFTADFSEEVDNTNPTRWEYKCGFVEVDVPSLV